MSLITEHSVKIKAELPSGDVNRKMEVFYNPVMVSNRNLSILLLNNIDNKNMKLANPLSGSGIRSLRFLKELKRDKIEKIFVNDFKEDFEKVFNENLKLNKLDKEVRDNDLVSIHNEEASLFLLNQDGFDYIDIDPFGTPNPFLAAALARISRDGILAVTATDTAALTGTYAKVTKRKYWATSMKNYLMHEIGLRILIRKVQLQGIQFDKALTPILSYHKDHYFRIFFRNQRGKIKCDNLLKDHQYFLYCNKCLSFKTSIYNKEKCNCGKDYNFAGPLWVGDLFDSGLISKMAENNHFKEDKKFIETLKEESKSNLVGFYDLHELSKLNKIAPQKLDIIMKKLNAVRTHFSPTGFKTDKSFEEVVSLFKKNL